MMKTLTGPVIAEEMKLITAMITLYYHKHPEKTQISREKMNAYALKRLMRCRFGEAKPTCKNCPIHCYRPDYREQMRQIMIYSGPRMLWHHPLLCLKHLIRGRKPVPEAKAAVSKPVHAIKEDVVI